MIRDHLIRLLEIVKNLIRGLFAPAREEVRAQREKIRRNIHENAVISFPYLFMNFLAAVVASYGLLSNSSAVVIGAMIIAMLLGPISGVALALVDGSNRLLVRALIAIAGGVMLVLAVSFIIGGIHADMPITQEMLSRTHPNILDLIIALAGGAAGAYATISPRISAGLVGVAIATALVPPLAACGLLFAMGHASLAAGAFLLFFTNLIAIQFVYSLVMWMFGFHEVTRWYGDNFMEKFGVFVRNAISFGLLIILTVVMSLNLSSYLDRERYENDIKKQIIAGLANIPGAYLSDVRFETLPEAEKITVVVRAPQFLSPKEVAKLEDSLPSFRGLAPNLHVLSITVKEASRNRFLYDSNQRVKIAHEDTAVVPPNHPLQMLTEAMAPTANSEKAEAEARNIQIFGK